MSSPFTNPPLGLGDDAVEHLANALADMMPGALSRDDDDPHWESLKAIATALVSLADQHEAVKRNIFPWRAVELLDEWEGYLGLTDDAERTTAQRQQRIKSAWLARAGAAVADIEQALLSYDPTPVAVFANKANALESQGAPERLIFQTAIEIEDAVYDDREQRKAIARIMEQLTPAAKWFQSGVGNAEDALVTNNPSIWAGTSGVFGKNAAAFFNSATTPYTIPPTKTEAGDYGGGPSRLREFASYTKLRAGDINAIQDSLLVRPARGSGVLYPYNGTGGGQQTVVFAAELPNAAATTVDTSMNWRQRLVYAAACVSAADIRPGKSSDTIVGTTAGGRPADLVWMGPGDAAPGFPGGYDWQLASNVHLYADSGSGSLKIWNNTGATAYVVMWLSASETLSNSGGPVSARVNDFSDGDTFAQLKASFISTMRTKTRIRKGNGPGADSWASWAGNGGNHRFFLVQLDTGASGAKVIDSLCDWRDRVILTAASGAYKPDWDSGGGALSFDGPVVPGSPDGGQGVDDLGDGNYMHVGEGYPTSPTPSTAVQDIWIGYTGLGNTQPSTLYQHDLEPLIAGTRNKSGVRLYADATTGHLIADNDGSVSAVGPRWVMVALYATEQIGQRSSPTALPTLTVTDTNPIHPAPLNDLQDRAFLGPVGENRANVVAPTIAQTPVEVQPLGQHAFGGGAFPIPMSYEPGFRTGFAHPLVTTAITRGVRQQPLGGSLSCYFASSPAVNTVKVIDDRDWRDRMVFGMGRWVASGAGTAISPLDTNDNTHNAATGWQSARYVGPGADLGAGFLSIDVGVDMRGLLVDHVGDVWIVVDEDTGALCLVCKAGGAGDVVTGWVTGGPRCGGYRL